MIEAFSIISVIAVSACLFVIDSYKTSNVDLFKK